LAKLDIVTFPDPVLKAPCSKIEGVNEELLRLAEDMVETMYQAPGVGLAANQVGVSRQLIVIDASSPQEPVQTVVLVNPRIIALSDEKETDEEGCLSVPDMKAEVERAVRVTVLAKNLKGEDLKIEAQGFLARVLQHEIDHLNATLIIDRIGRLKRERYVKQRKQALAGKKSSVSG